MPRAISRRLFSVLALVAGFLVIPFAPAAHADAGCPGSWDIKRDWKNSAGTVAASTQFYDVSGGGMCVSLVAKGAYYGRSKTMALTVCTVEKTRCQTDSGTFLYYAGPITRPASDGICFWIHAKMGDGYGNILFDKSEYSGACD